MNRLGQSDKTLVALRSGTGRETDDILATVTDLILTKE